MRSAYSFDPKRARDFRQDTEIRSSHFLNHAKKLRNVGMLGTKKLSKKWKIFDNLRKLFIRDLSSCDTKRKKIMGCIIRDTNFKNFRKYFMWNNWHIKINKRYKFMGFPLTFIVILLTSERLMRYSWKWCPCLVKWLCVEIVYRGT